MKCKNCGFEVQDNLQICPICNTAMDEAVTTVNPAANTILQVLKDGLFLAICILLSTSCIFSIAADSIPLINILTAVFLWLVYAKSNKGIADAEQLRNVSGTIYAKYILNNILSIILIVVGLLVFAVFDMVVSDPKFLNIFTKELGATFPLSVDMLAALSGVAILIIFAISAIGILLLNIFSIRYIHRFAKSVYQSILTGVLKLKHVKAAKVWLIIFGVCSSISTLTLLSSMQITAALSSGTTAAAEFLAAILIGKYLTLYTE